MSDEIDIEEHDLLDNPTIRKIFPDLSIIKKEISQYEEELDAAIEETTSEAVAASDTEAELTIDQHSDSGTYISKDLNSQNNTQQSSKDKQLEIHLRFKTFLDSLADDIFENSDDGQSVVFNDTIPSSPIKITELVKDQNEKNIKSSSNNIFILGSKPSLTHSEKKRKEKRQLKIALKNVWPYLNESKQYCKHCSVLYPNVDAFNFHMNKVHTLRTSDSLKNKHDQNRLKYTEIKFKCEICHIALCSKGNLVRHLKTVHKKPANLICKTRRSSKQSSKMIETKKSLLKDLKTNSTESNNCFHCHKEFDSQSALIEHLYDVLNPSKESCIDSTKNKEAGISEVNSVSVVDKGGGGGGEIHDTEFSTSGVNRLTRSILEENKNETYLNSNSVPSKQMDQYLQKAYSACKGLIKSNLIESIKTYSRLNKPTENNKKCITKSAVIAEKSSESDQNFLVSQNTDSSERVIANCIEKHIQVENSSNFISMQKTRVYQCYVCSQYMRFWKGYSTHMNGHDIRDVLNADTVVFDAQCKFCDEEKLYDIRLYNRHVSLRHREKIHKKIKRDEKAYQSVLFKCLNCSVCFLTANASKTHHEHDAIFVNWKCLDCHRLLKIKDKAVHLKQHLLSKNITVYALSDSALNRVLYKCLRCAVHFSEKEYLIHHAICGLEMPNSAYCNICDILINKNDIASHELNHKHKKLQLHDFTLIESDLINVVKEQKAKEKQNTRTKSKFALTFCHTCNCFLGDIGRKRKAHIEGRCGIINPRMCRKCGLVFTSRGYISHKTLHDKEKSLNLQRFYFYDMQTKKQIRPPIPEYPNCKICEVHFLSKQAINEHLCTIEGFTTCSFCKIHLTEAAFKLHVNFHKYKLSSTELSKNYRKKLNAENAITSTTNSTANIPITLSSKTLITYKRPRSKLKLMERSSSEVEEAVTSTTSSNTITLSPQNLISNVPENTSTSNSSVLFTCVLCQITVNMYDKVVEHCHDHYDYKENLLRGKNAYINDTFEANLATKIMFDPFYIRFDKDTWMNHIFKEITTEQTLYILEHTKYKFECRLKLEEIQPGSSSNVNSSTLYKCDICRSYVDPNELYAHAGTTCTLTRKHPCSVCGLCFTSQSYKIIHEKTHENSNISTASYKIILFNKRVHQQFIKMMFASRNKFILYQCRNCEVIIDKLQREVHECNSVEVIKCSYCGLLFYDKDLKVHVTKHELIKNFQSQQMIVVMFGKLGCQRDNKIKSSFNGTIYDFTFYKCTNCGLCLKSKNNVNKHVCVSKLIPAPQCPKCYLFFLPKDLEEHFQLHEKNLELFYDDFKSNIVSFTNNTVVQDTIQNALNQKQDKIEKESNVNTEVNDTRQKIYKCRCGLHFLEEINAMKHLQNCTSRIKISKQSCFKCDLLFTPEELFDHLLKHHSNKKIQYKYDIIIVSESRGNGDVLNN